MPPTDTELPTKYTPADHEPGVRERWTRSGAFHADPTRVGPGRPPYAVVIPPPNVTDRLHLGHALNNTIQDILVRAHRMRGRETIWLPGTDHAGIATQTRVERMLLETEGRRRTDYPRDEFVAIVQRWKDDYERHITDQLERLGCSCDWDRQRFTMDEVCARAVREAFFRLFRDGLIYRGKRLVNWDPATLTALADDEVEMREVDGAFYYLRYPLVHGEGPAAGRPATWSELLASGYPREHLPPGEGVDDEDPAFVTVATTRPETYLGDTAVAVHPHDPRAGALDGLLAQLPLVGREIPIIRDDYVVLPDAVTGEDSGDPKARFATGFLKVTPAHDPNDEQIGIRHDLPTINVLAPDASVSDAHGWEDVGDARIFVGLSREDARKKVRDEFHARGLLEDRKPYRHSVGHSYRSHVAIEPYLSDQWYVRVRDDRLVGAAQRALASEQRTTDTHPARRGAAGDAELRFFPDRYARTYETWHDNIRDWCISRQLWWGHRIPVWRGTGHLIESGDLDSLAAHVDRLNAWRGEGRLAYQLRGEYVRLTPAELDDECISAFFVCVRDPDGADREIVEYLEGLRFERDPDVLDTWFSSALWPISTMGWPEPDARDDTRGLLDAFNPTDVLCTAREIITLWVSRMVMFNRYFLGTEGPGEHGEGGEAGRVPFRDVFIHAMIQDGEGRKMSKSLGNGVDPLDIVHSHGADALRFTLCQMTTQTQDVRMPVETDPETGRNTSPKFDVGRNFCTKLWNAARFVMMKLREADGAGGDPGAGSVNSADLGLADRWILSRLGATVRRTERALAEYQFKDYADALYDLLWRDYCDWYLEAVKPTVATEPGQRAVLGRVLDAILRLLHPICPFVTEVLAERLAEIPLPQVRGLTLGPIGDDPLCVAPWPEVDPGLDAPRDEATFDRLRSLTEAVRQTRAQRSIKSRERPTLHATPEVAALCAEGGSVVESLAGLGAVTAEPPTDGGAPEIRFEGASLLLGGVSSGADDAALRERAAEELAGLERDVAALEKRLSNPGYVERAPAKLVQETRDQLAAKVAERDALRERLG